MTTDPSFLLEVAYAIRLNMTPSEFRSKASRWDMIQIAAFDLTQTEDYQKRLQIERDKNASKGLTPEQKAAILMGGL